MSKRTWPKGGGAREGHAKGPAERGGYRPRTRWSVFSFLDLIIDSARAWQSKIILITGIYDRIYDRGRAPHRRRIRATTVRNSATKVNARAGHERKFIVSCPGSTRERRRNARRRRRRSLQTAGLSFIYLIFDSKRRAAWKSKMILNTRIRIFDGLRLKRARGTREKIHERKSIVSCPGSDVFSLVSGKKIETFTQNNQSRI